MHQPLLFTHEFDSPKVTLSATSQEQFTKNVYIFLLDIPEADFAILIPGWICTREYPGRATPHYKLSFGTIWQVRYRFRVDSPVIFLRLICTREYPLEPCSGNSPLQIKFETIWQVCFGGFPKIGTRTTVGCRKTWTASDKAQYMCAHLEKAS